MRLFAFIFCFGCLLSIVRGQNPFENPAHFSIKYPTECSNFDIDQDGDIDLIVANTYQIMLFENHNNETFLQSREIHREDDPMNISNKGILLIEDINQDGKNDIVFRSDSGQNIAWLENYGDGHFSSKQIIYENGEDLRSFQCGDLDNDGDPDIVIAHAQGSVNANIIPLENDGTGVFTALESLGYLEEVLTIAIEDDQENPYIAVGCVREIVGFEHVGQGMEYEYADVLYESQFPATINPEKVLVRDTNQDGTPEVYVKSTGASSLQRTQQGSGNLSTFLSIDGEITDFGFADMDGDGKEDILLCSDETHQISWSKKANEGITFNNVEILVEDIESASIIQAADFNQDSLYDLVCINFAIHGITIVHATDYAQFQTTPQQIIEVLDYFTEPFVLDFNGDELTDHVFQYRSFDKWTANLYESTDDGDVEVATKLVSFENPDYLLVSIEDTDNDEDYDLLVINPDQDLILLENLGGYAFADPQLITSEFGNPEHTYWHVDLNGDGHDDIVSGHNLHGISWYENIANGYYSEQIEISNAACFQCFDADFDGDNDNDLVYSVLENYLGPLEIYWLENDGNANGWALHNITADGPHQYFSIADFNNDGLADVLCPPMIQINEGAGEIFTEEMLPPFDVDYQFFPSSADLDNDNDMDIICPYRIPSTTVGFAVFENEGDGEFSSPLTQEFAYGLPRIPHVFDKDNDGDVDLSVVLTGGLFTDYIVQFENDMYQGTGCTDEASCNFNPLVIVDDGSCIYTGCYLDGDFNGDGQIDTSDLLDILSQIGCTMECDADLNNDGIVNITDIIIFLGYIGMP